TVAEAPAEVPLLMQVADNKGEIVVGFWQEGARFPEQILTPGTQVASVPRWYDGPEPGAPTTPSEPAVATGPDTPPVGPAPKPPREPKGPKPPSEPKEPSSREGRPSVPIAIAGGLLGGAGALAAGAAISHGRLSKASSEDELVRIQTTTNVLTLSA